MFPRIALVLPGAAVLTAAAHAQLPLLHHFDGPTNWHRFGTAVAGAGDVDGDGFADVIAGATDGKGYLAQGTVGHARVLSGRDGRVLHTFTGDRAGADAFGGAVAGAGDVDGDGHDDLIVGAKYDRTAAVFAGRVVVYSGATGRVLHELFGGAGGDRLGVAVAGPGDVDGDGLADIAAGAYFANANGFWSGSVYVWSGRNGRLLWKRHGDHRYFYLGFAVAGAGDVDADGTPDLIAGAYGDDTAAANAGLARVYSGSDGRVLYDLHGSFQGERFGSAVAGAGDLDGDGHAEVMVGGWDVATPTGHRPGIARVFSGADGSAMWTFLGDAPNDRFGGAVAGAGDVNGDSVPDVAVGAYYDGTNGTASGSVSVFSGATGQRLARHHGDGPDSFFGVAVAGAGDTNADGFADVIAGAHLGSQGTEAGSARVLAVSGAERYGTASGSGGPLLLEWAPGAPLPAAGTLHATGGTPGAAGRLGLSLAADTRTFGNLELLIDVTPGSWSSRALAFDAGGRATVPVDLRMPALAGTVIHAQALDAAAPSLSNGLRLLLTR